MRNLLLVLCLCFTTANAIAAKDHVHVQCWSGDKLIFNKNVIDIWLADGYVAALGKAKTYIISGDCVSDFVNAPEHKHKHKQVGKTLK